MNAKQTVPLIATLAPAIATVAPVVIIGGAIFLTLKWIFSDDENENKSEIAPANSETETQRKDAETAVFRQIPAEIRVKSAFIPAISVHAPVAAPSIPKIIMHAPAPMIKSAVQIPQPPVKKKFITREDLATIFNRGTRSLNRKAVVAALKSLGFGRTAAYAALTPDGRFSAWLQFAPDGIITWTE